MMTRRYSEDSLRALIESLSNPVCVLHREGRLRMVNEAYLEMLGLGREQVEGQLFLEFVHSADRLRFQERYRQREVGTRREAEPPRYLLPAMAGKPPRELAVHVQEVELEGSGRVVLVNNLVLGERPGELVVAERLVETSAQLVSARSEDAVRRTALAGISAAGLVARFLVLEGERFVARDETAMPEAQETCRRAVSEGRSIFSNRVQEVPTAVYLPLGTTHPEVLWVSGDGLSPSYGPVLTLFAKVVGAALTDARLLADVERGRWEMAAVAEVARFVAMPEPPSPGEFLTRLAALLGAEVALLYSAPSSEAELVPVARVGPEELLLTLHVPLFGGKRAPEGSGRCVVLSSAEEERALREASGGRLGCGAAVRLSQGEQGWGVLQVLRAPGRPFGPADLRLLGTLAELVMMLLDQRRLRSESARQLADTRLLLDLARTTTATLEVASILDVASDFLVRLLDVSNCFIMLYDEQDNVLRGAAASITHRDFFRGVVIPLDEPGGIAAHVARERRAIALPDLSQVEGMAERELVRRFEEKALLGLPLMSRDELIGVVLLDDTRGPRAFAPALIEQAEATCGQIAMAIANALLYESLWASYAELAAARAEMVKRERLVALGELSAVVAHEVRNPLGSIFNAVASLRRMLKPEGDAAVLLNILSEESDRLNRLVTDLLEYTRPREPIRQPEDVGRLLQDAVDAACLQQDRPSELSLVVEVAPELGRVPLDRRLIRQALINVILNAIQSMPQGGMLRVLARGEKQGPQELLRIDVVDQGCGIPPELMHRVFEPFFTNKAQGTGLGLAVVKRIVEEHQGEISLESVQGRGTTFTLRLPFTQSVSSP